MALNLQNKYPGRFDPVSADYPQGKFKNRSSPTAQDGSYMERDWLNDWAGFLGALLSNAGVTPNGNVDTAQSSQFYDALGTVVLKKTGAFLIGVPLPWPTSTPPAGFIALTGQAINQTTDPLLYARYGATAPDMRAEIVRGWDNGRGVDTGRVLLSTQGDAIRNITGSLSVAKCGEIIRSATGVFSRSTATQQSNAGHGLPSADSDLTINFSASESVPTANENRMRNVAWNYITMRG